MNQNVFTLSTMLIGPVTLKPSDIISREAPCCGACYLTVQALNLFYWPDQDDSTPRKRAGTDTVRAIHARPDTPPSYVDENGFTLYVTPGHVSELGTNRIISVYTQVSILG